MQKLQIKNEFCVKNGIVKMIVLSKDGGERLTLFNDYFLLEVVKYSWFVDSAGYVNNGGKIRLHQIISGRKNGLVCDHIDGNKLNNLSQNIRLTSKSINNRNTKGKGYYYSKRDKKWIVQICINYSRKTIGRFKTELEAKNARVLAEIKHYGEASYINKNQ